MKGMKFRVKDEQHSKEIQEALFAAGYSWGYGNAGTERVENTGYTALFATENGRIMYSSESDHDDAYAYFTTCGDEEFVLYNGNFIPVGMQPATEQPAEKPLVRPRKQFLQERQVELLKAMLADAEDGKMISDDYASELADNHQILESLT